MRYTGRFLWLISIVFFVNSCGIPNNADIPPTPISLDSDSTDNIISFQAPASSNVSRYIIWYKIYPLLSRTTTDSLITSDVNYLGDNNIRALTQIRARDYHRLQLSSNVSDGYYLLNLLNAGDSAFIDLDSTDKTNYFKVRVGSSTFNVRRDVPVSLVDNARKKFYKDFIYSSDADTSTRASSDFAGYTATDKGFAVTFLAQSAYVNVENLSLLTSELLVVGTFYSADGFEN